MYCPFGTLGVAGCIHHVLVMMLCIAQGGLMSLHCADPLSDGHFLFLMLMFVLLVLRVHSSLRATGSERGNGKKLGS
jgi:hypothetical protein